MGYSSRVYKTYRTQTQRRKNHARQQRHFFFFSVACSTANVIDKVSRRAVRIEIVMKRHKYLVWHFRSSYTKNTQIHAHKVGRSHY